LPSLPRLTAAEAERPGAAELAALRDKAEGLAALASQRLTWRGRLAELAECRADAGFFATPFAGQDVPSNRARTRAAVERALALFPDAAGGEAPCHGLTAEESLTAREGCCELLLHLAAVTLEPAAGEDAGRRKADADEALRLLDRAAGYGVETPVLAARRAACLARLGREAEAAAERRRASADLRRPFEWFLHGNDRFRAGEVRNAVEDYQQVLSREPDHFGARYALGVCYLRLAADGPDQRLTNVQLAQAHLDHCVSRHKDRVWPFIQRGLARGEARDFAGAEEDFDRAEGLLAGAPDPTALYGVLVNRGLVRVGHKNADGAVADLTRAVALRPGEWQAYVNLAAAYTEQGRRAEAAAQLDKAVALKPAGGLAAVHRNRARLRQQAGDLVAAADELGQAAAAEPAGSVAARAGDHLRRARLLEQAGRHAEAIAAADDALRLRPDGPAAHRTRAEALLHLGRYAEAVAALDRCLDRAGAAEQAAVYEARARARAHLGDPASAAEDFTRVLGCRPDDPAALTGRGWAYVALEASALAERDFDRAVRLGLGNADALLGRAYVRVKAASLAEGLRDAEEALRPGRREPQLLFDAARVFARAARRVEDDPARQGPSGLQERGRLEGRALDLLRAALEALPADRQAPFWSQRVERDAALGPLKRTAAYRQMAGTFAHPVGREGPR
jgi:tetratricopeptide (TPR) repeat protein